MAVKFKHKETGLFFCRAKRVSPSIQKERMLGEDERYSVRDICQKEEGFMNQPPRNRRHCGSESITLMSLK